MSIFADETMYELEHCREEFSDKNVDALSTFDSDFQSHRTTYHGNVNCLDVPTKLQQFGDVELDSEQKIDLPNYDNKEISTTEV